MEWKQEDFRRELYKLDKKTGLDSSKLRIKIGKAKTYIGTYCIKKSTNQKWFRFSAFYFNDENFPKEAAIEVIKHEYAHFYDDVMFGGRGHGESWKKACEIVGTQSTNRVFEMPKS